MARKKSLILAVEFVDVEFIGYPEVDKESAGEACGKPYQVDKERALKRMKFRIAMVKLWRSMMAGLVFTDLDFLNANGLR